MEMRIVTRKDSPVLEIRLVIFSGTASDGERPGLAALTGEVLKAGGAVQYAVKELARQAESLGAELEISTTRDATSVGLGVTSVDAERALALLADIALSPRFSRNVFEKLKQRAIVRVKNQAAGNADWAASMLLYRQLFAVPLGTHPYAHCDAWPSEIERLFLPDCRVWYERHFTPQNALLVVTGDIDPATVQRSAERLFSAWTGSRPAPVAFPSSSPPSQPNILVVDRPRSGQSEIYLALLGPERASSAWPAFAASNQILGGGIASRLFSDLHEKRALAYHTASTTEEPAHGPAPLVLSLVTQTQNTASAVQALLENLQRMADIAPVAWEIEMAARSLLDELLFQTQRLGTLAELTAKLALLGLSDDYCGKFRQELERLVPAGLLAVARRHYAAERPVIVIAGDANVVAEPLRQFGDVAIASPAGEFATLRELPRKQRR
jgi:predicted Zn-dependent peptidase